MKLNEYLIEIERYFGGKMEFTVEAMNKQSALEKAKACAKHSSKFSNCKRDSIKVVKKLYHA